MEEGMIQKHLNRIKKLGFYYELVNLLEIQRKLCLESIMGTDFYTKHKLDFPKSYILDAVTPDELERWKEFEPIASTQLTKQGSDAIAIEILTELCELKHYKDTVGKDSVYEKRQPEAWKRANIFLNNRAIFNPGHKPVTQDTLRVQEAKARKKIMDERDYAIRRYEAAEQIILTDLKWHSNMNPNEFETWQKLKNEKDNN